MDAWRWVLGVVAMQAAGAAWAGTGASHPCAETVDPAERLACYDRHYPPPAPVQRAAEARALDRFGRDAEAAAVLGPAVPGQLEASVAEIARGPAGEREVMLDNGQRWRITEGDARGVLAVGDPVVVRKAALGSFMLVTRAGVPLRARRVR